MILAGLTIRDYKQFAGEHQLEPERQGIMAVIGPNGAGKTTLFEAIEWCLYGPRSIANSDVFPRGTGGQPLVRVTLEDPGNGRRIVVERRLSRSKVMQAEVWDEANPGEMLATGSAPVKKFVSEQLIGLGHAAFISTFFTRQKELSFFGAVGDTKRRRMVGQMIGLEAVRLAQESIGAERARAASLADALGANAAHEADDRDFAAEITVAVAAVSEADALVARRTAESIQARQALEQVNAEADRIRARSEQDQALGVRLAEFEAARGRLETRIDGLDAELARLAQEAARRKELAPIALLQADRAASVERWTQEQQRQSKIEERRRAVRDLETERTNVLQTVGGLVTNSATPFAPEWTWRRDVEPDTEINRLLAVNATLDLDELRQGLARAQESRARIQDLEKARKELARFQSFLVSLKENERALLSAGDPKATVERLRLEIEAHRSSASRCESERNQALERAAQLKPLLANLHEHTFGDFCPTCGRTITEIESADVIRTLSEQIESWNVLAQTRANDVREAQSRVKQLDAQIADSQKLADELLEIRTRISNGNQRIAEKTDEVEGLERAINGGSRTVDAAELSDEAIAELERRVEACSAVGAAAHGLAQRHAQLEDLAGRTEQATRELAELGQAAYDAQAHRDAQAALDEANRAVATIQNIDRDLARRSDIDAQRADTISSLDGIRTSIVAVTSERTELGFSDVESTRARAIVTEANEADRQAMAHLHLAQTAARERQTELKSLRDQEQRIKQQLERSAALQRNADELGEMYKEFGIFDQYVAARVAPRLAEQTSQLLETATDGKFSSVEFDENYGIQVYDGLNEKFPLETFSGGERDVVALCARLALSQLIGGAAAHPPSFLVLDEVFGALDRDRRVQLLELLGRISESIESFQQMFIISHVDDVRTSPIFSRVLRVTESADGSSRIDDVTLAAAIDE